MKNAVKTDMRIAVILAGGEGKRMGGADKGAVKIGDHPMIDLIHARLGPQCGKILISGDHDYGLGCDVIPDIAGGPQGPAAGLYAIWHALNRSGLDGFFTVPVDGPNLPHDLLARLYRREISAIARDDNGLQPVFAWWRLSDLGKAWEALDLGGSISLHHLARFTQARRVTWAGEAMFRNINTANDLAAFRKTR